MMMTSDKLDAIIFGATGFTGQLVVEDALEILKDFQWGIAGRNESKLKGVLNVLGQRIKKDLSHIPIIVADVGDVKSIENMAKKCKIVINCCGPYGLYGEVVVKACIEAGTHHVDVSGEPQYINKMQWKYNKLAQEKGAYVVSTLGFESIPSELGVLYAERNFPGTINSIELFWETNLDYQDTSSKVILSSATWESAVCSMSHGCKILNLERKLNREEIPSLRPRLWMKPWVRKTEGLNSYFLLFPATDRSVVKRSQRLSYAYEKKRPIQFEMYMGLNSFWLGLWLPIAFFFIAIMAQCGCTRSILLKYPKFFTFGLMSHEGPTEANKNAIKFNFTLKAKGWSQGTPESSPPNKEIIVRVSDKDSGYGLSSNSLLIGAKVILNEHHKMPGTGGVLPPAFAFSKTQTIEELERCKSGLKFEVVKQ